MSGTQIEYEAQGRNIPLYAGSPPAPDGTVRVTTGPDVAYYDHFNACWYSGANGAAQADMAEAGGNKITAYIRADMHADAGTVRVLEAAKALVPHLKDGWDECDEEADQEAANAAVSDLIAAVEALAAAQSEKPKEGK